MLSLARERTLAAVLDLPDEFLALQPAGARNHPAWTLGHLLYVESVGAKVLGVATDIPPGWDARYATGTAPEPKRALYPLKSELFDRLARQRLALLARVEGLAAADIERAAPPLPVLGRSATWGDVLMYLAWHEGYHNGQLAVWRRDAGIGQAATE
jgi:uncharacterized damage-inducible protein DinB